MVCHLKEHVQMFKSEKFPNEMIKKKEKLSGLAQEQGCSPNWNRSLCHMMRDVMRKGPIARDHVLHV